MSWTIKDEHVDLAEGVHRIIYVNPEILTRDGKPQEHQHIILLRLNGCPYCGHVSEQGERGEIDVEAEKRTVLGSLSADHAKMLNYAKKHNLRVLAPGGKAQ